MKQMLIDLVQAIVDHPEEVSVTERISGDTVVLELTVADDATHVALGNGHTNMMKKIV